MANNRLLKANADAESGDSGSMTTQALIQAFNTPAAFERTLLTAEDVADVTAVTFGRDVQVGTNVWANQQHTDAENPHSIFNKLVYQDSAHPQHGLTPVGIAMAVAGPSMMALGIGKRVYQLRRAMTVQSYDYALRQLNLRAQRLKPGSPKMTKAELIAGYERLLNKNVLDEQNEIPLDAAAALQFESHPVIKWINNIKKKSLVEMAGASWNFLANNQSFSFWMVFWPFAVAVGITAAVTAYMPVILGITGGVGALTLAYRGMYALGTKYLPTYSEETAEDIQAAIESEDHKDTVKGMVYALGYRIKLLAYKTFSKKPEGAVVENEIQKVNQLKQLFFIEQEHNIIMDRLREYGYDAPLAEEAAEHAQGKYVLDKRSKKVIRLARNSAAAAIEIDAPPVAAVPRPSLAAVRNSEIGKQLLGSKAEQHIRLGLNLASTLLGGIIAALFVAWYGSSVIGLVPVVGAVATGFLGTATGAQVLFGASAAIGGLFTLSSFAQLKADQLAHEKKVYMALTAPYKNENISKLEKFEQLMRDINARKDEVRALRRDLVGLGKRSERDLAAKCDLHVDPYNHYLFEKQKYNPSTWTRVKQVGNRVYELLGGGESGVFLVRSLFLIGGIAAACLAATGIGAPVAFGLIALSAFIVYGGLKIAQSYTDRRQKHRETAVESIDARIAYCESRKIEIDAVKSVLEVNKAQAQLQAPVAPEASPRPQVPGSVPGNQPLKSHLVKVDSNKKGEISVSVGKDHGGDSAKSAPSSRRASLNFMHRLGSADPVQNDSEQDPLLLSRVGFGMTGSS